MDVSITNPRDDKWWLKDMGYRIIELERMVFD